MNRDYFHHHSHAQSSPEPRDLTTTISPQTPPVPGMQRGYASNYAASGFPATSGLTGGSLRSTRSSQANTAYARPQGSLRRNGYLLHEASAQSTAAAYEDTRYNAPNLQPFVPDPTERRGTPEHYGANNSSSASAMDHSYRRNQHYQQPPPLPSPINTHGSSYNIPPARSASRARRQSRDGTTSNHSSGDFSRHAALLGSARLVSGRVDGGEPGVEALAVPSQRVEFGSTNKAKASLSPSLSPERDEIADIIADMSTARITSGDDNDFGDSNSSDALFIGGKSSVHVYLQLGDSTKRVALTERPSRTILVNLFIEKYRGRLAEDSESLPAIYINDAKSHDLFYELEDMADIVDGSILSWRTQPLSSTNSKAKPFDNGKDDASLKSEVGGLALIVRSLAETVAQLPAQIRSELVSAVGEVKDHTSAAVGSIKAQPDTAGMPSGVGVERRALARSTSTPVVGNAELDELHARVQRLELALSVERQERREEVAAAELAKTEAIGELEKLKDSAARHPNVLRVRIEEGKNMLKNEYRQLNTQFEDVHALVQEMRKDVAQRGSIPSSQMMRKATTDLKAIGSGTEKLVAFINETRSDWKRTWEEELQNILKEQSFVKDVEQMLGELIDDTHHLDDVIDKLNKIIDLKLRERAKDDYVPSAATKFFDVVSPDDAPDAKKDFLMQISCVDVDHERRLDALKTAERVRQTELAAKVNEFDEELSDFVTQRKLRKTGGTEELERRRAEKEVEIMKEMLRCAEEVEQARRAKLAQRKAGGANKKQNT